LTELWHRWRVLAKEHQEHADTLRPTRPDKLTVTFSWASGVDGVFAQAIETAIHQAQKAEAAWRKRAVPNS
jgi:hypothetical protein